MKLWYVENGKEKYLEVDYFSFAKCWLLSWLGFSLIAFIIGFMFGLLSY